MVCDGVSSATRPDDASLAAARASSESLLAALPRGTHPQQALHEGGRPGARGRQVVRATRREPCGRRFDYVRRVQSGVAAEDAEKSAQRIIVRVVPRRR